MVGEALVEASFIFSARFLRDLGGRGRTLVVGPSTQEDGRELAGELGEKDSFLRELAV